MIIDNPFHVLGLTANCGTREKAGRETKIKRYVEIQRPLVFEGDLYFEGCHRNEVAVGRAVEALHDAGDRIGPGLFWFTRDGVLDDHGLRLLTDGDMIGALATWQRIEDRPPTRAYASSLNNLGTVCLLMTLTGTGPGHAWSGDSPERTNYLRRGLRAKTRLVGGLSGPDLSSFCATFSDGMATRDPDQIATIFADSLEQFKGEAEKYGLELPTGTLVSFLDSGGPRTAGLRKRFALGPRQELERAIRACAAAYERDASKAATAGNDLMTVAKDQLPELAALVSKTEYRYTSLADSVADQLLNASVAYFNYHVDADSVSLEVASSSMSFVRYAAGVACGAAVSGRAQENLDEIAKVQRGFRKQREMERVRAPMQAWFDQASELVAVNPAPSELIAFVRQALGVSEAPASSAVALMDAVRRQGSKTFGVRFQSSDEMLECGSLVCNGLVNCSVAAFNSAHLASNERAAAQLLPKIYEHFVAQSNALPHRSAAFLINDECFEHLVRNLSAAKLWLAQSLRQVPARSSGSGGSGCLIAFALLGGVWIVIGALEALDERDDTTARSEPQFSVQQEAVPSATDAETPGTPLEFRIPPGAVRRALSLPEIRWCVRQEDAVNASERRLESRARPVSESEVERYNAAADQHNIVVANYNSRCGQFSYRRGDLERARREVRSVFR